MLIPGLSAHLDINHLLHMLILMFEFFLCLSLICSPNKSASDPPEVSTLYQIYASTRNTRITGNLVKIFDCAGALYQGLKVALLKLPSYDSEQYVSQLRELFQIRGNGFSS